MRGCAGEGKGRRKGEQERNAGRSWGHEKYPVMGSQRGPAARPVPDAAAGLPAGL